MYKLANNFWKWRELLWARVTFIRLTSEVIVFSFDFLIFLTHLRPTFQFYLSKVSNGNERTVCEICSKLTMKPLERREWRLSGVFTVSFEQISHIVGFEQVIASCWSPSIPTENFWFSDVFRGYRKIFVAWNGLTEGSCFTSVAFKGSKILKGSFKKYGRSKLPA